MPSNYNPSSGTGVPYVRAHRIVIEWPDRGLLPSARIEQSEAVVVADGTIRQIGMLPTIQRSLDLVNAGDEPIQIVDPETGAPIEGRHTTLNEAFLAVLAVVRKLQLEQGGT